MTGSIDAYSGFSLGPELGSELHDEIQYHRVSNNPRYEPEVWVSHSFNYGKYVFELVGKIDGVCKGHPTTIEEIKTGFDIKKLSKFIQTYPDHPYLLQLKTYGYIYWVKTNKIPLLNLHLVSSRNKSSTDFNVTLDINEYELWLKHRLKSLAQEIKKTEKRIEKRKKLSASLIFPFEKPRLGQGELVKRVQTCMEKSSPLLIQAPTGLGKTVGILYPALQESLRRGQKTIYITPKNSQHMVAYDAVKNLRKSGSKIKSLMLSAKKKICMKNEPLCNAEYCEFADGHYTKVSENNLIEQLKKEKHLSFYSFRKIADTYKICPYELQMDLIHHADVIICDYNYVFSPHAKGSRVAKLFLAEKEKPNLVIDEIHNLPNRTLDYFSPALSALFFEKSLQFIQNIPEELQTRFRSLLESCQTIITNHCANEMRKPHLITPNIQLFKEQDTLLRDFLMAYLETDVVISPHDMVLNIFNYWHDFTDTLEWIGEHQKPFIIAYYPHTLSIKITCCDASELIKEYYDLFSQIIGFSATLKPFDFYSQLIGLKSKKLQTAEFSSPFPKENKKLIIIPQVSSRYIDRKRNYPRIAEAIRKISELKKGNYFAFFPSFEFMENVLSFFTPPDGFKLFSQYHGMRQEDVRKVLTYLSTDDPHIIFAVQGGLFSEGIDYPGKMAIGAFVVGTALPTYNWEREKLKEYYHNEFLAGEAYAYIYPAMTKAIQAAGRVIRSEHDKGIIVLMDNRFLHPDYVKCMPNDWYEKEPSENVSSSILSVIKEFWEQHKQ